MARRLVIADASPLIGLAAIEAFDLLRGLFGNITVTEAVHREVLAGVGSPGAMELAAAMEKGWVDVVPSHIDAKFADLGDGEATTLTLALEQPDACLVLMDERSGRSYAKEHGVSVAGLIGVIREAKNAGLIPEIRHYIDRLTATDFRVSAEILQAALKRAGEG